MSDNPLSFPSAAPDGPRMQRGRKKVLPVLQVQAVHSELIGGDAEPPTARGLGGRGRVKGLVGGR